MTKEEWFRRQAIARDRRNQRYAIKFAIDSEMVLGDSNAEPTDRNLQLVLAHCVRPPYAEEYPEIRRYVELYRAGEMEL